MEIQYYALFATMEEYVRDHLSNTFMQKHMTNRAMVGQQHQLNTIEKMPLLSLDLTVQQKISVHLPIWFCSTHKKYRHTKLEI